MLGYYAVNYLSVPFTLQDEITTDRQAINTGELVVKAEYPSINKAKTNWYWQKKGIKKLSFYPPAPFSIHV